MCELRRLCGKGDVGHRSLKTNGIRMHLAEAGTGPLVMLCHGCPESWYSWRYQLTALSEAGFHAVAPDMRGYGRTDRRQLSNTRCSTWLATS
jgi:pimeloyl-ACP methyl ester carboxylesterase